MSPDAAEPIKQRKLYAIDETPLKLNPNAIKILTEDIDESQESQPLGKQVPVKTHRGSPNDVIIPLSVIDHLRELANSDQPTLETILASQALIEIERIQASIKPVDATTNLAVLSNDAKVYFVQPAVARNLRTIPKHDLAWSTSIAYVKSLFEKPSANAADTSPCIYRSIQFVSEDPGARVRFKDALVHTVADIPALAAITDNCVSPFLHESISDPFHRYTGKKVIDLSPAEFTVFETSQPSLLESASRPQPLLGETLYENQFLEIHVGETTHYRILKGHELKATALHIGSTVPELILSHNAGPEKQPSKKGISIPAEISDATLQEIIDMHPDDRTTLAPLLAQNYESKEDAYRELMWRVTDSAHRARQTRRSHVPTDFDDSVIPRGEQVMAMELLMDPDKEIVTIDGEAGCGKTLLAVQAGLLQLAMGRYRTLMYVRPLVGLDEGLGYVPGSQEKKLEEWVEVFQSTACRVLGSRKWPEREGELLSLIAKLREQRKIKTIAATKVGGATIYDTFWIIDEAHNFTLRQIDVLITRAGEGAKVVLLGDPGQIENQVTRASKYLSAASNGFSHVPECYKGNISYWGHIKLYDVRRSRVAESARLLPR